MKTTLTTRLVAMLASAIAASLAHADPMRPLVPPPAASAASPAGAGVAAATAAVAAPLRSSEREWPRLVAIRQDSEQRWQALFGERWLSVGDKLEGATVAHIEGNQVQLSDGRQRRTQHLLPPLWRPEAAAKPVAEARAGGLPSNPLSRPSTP